MTSAGSRPAIAKYIIAAAAILGVPLAVVAFRLASTPPPPVTTAPSASAPPPLARVEIEVTSTVPDALVTIDGNSHRLPWTGDLDADDSETAIEVTAPGHEGRVFHVVMDRPRRLNVTLPVGKGSAVASLEELDQALNGDDDELVLGPADAGDDSGPRRPALTTARRTHPVPSAAHSADPTPTATATAPAVTTAVATAPPPTTTAVPTATTAPVPTPTVEAPVVKPGTIDPRQVRATVRAHAGEVQTCYDRAHMETPSLSGRLTIEASVSPTGHVQSARVASTDIRSPRLESCILTAFQRWTFPPPAGGVPGTVTYSFVFKE